MASGRVSAAKKRLAQEERQAELVKTGKPAYIPRKVAPVDERKRMAQEAKFYAEAKPKGQAAVERYQHKLAEQRAQREKEKQAKLEQEEAQRVLDEELRVAELEKEVAAQKKAKAEADALQLKFLEKQYKRQQEKEEARRGRVSQGNLGETELRARQRVTGVQVKPQTKTASFLRVRSKTRLDEKGRLILDEEPAQARPKSVRKQKQKFKEGDVVGIARGPQGAARAVVQETGVELEGERKQPYQKKVKTPWERTYPITRRKPTAHVKRAKEQPRVKGRFAKKPTSMWDLSPGEFAMMQQGKLERGEISSDSYYRYVREYDQRHPEKRFKADRYRMTFSVYAERNGVRDYRSVTGTYNHPNPTRAELDEMKEQAGFNFTQSGWKVLRVERVAVYDQLTGKRVYGRGG